MSKRIALVLPDMGGGGAERVALALAEGFLDRGNEVDLVLMRAEGELLGLLPRKARLFDLKAKRIRNVLWPLVRYLRERRPDAVQASMWPLTIVAILARMLAGSKARLVVSDHNNLVRAHAQAPFRLRVISWTMRLFYPLAEARVCVSAPLGADLSHLSGLDRRSFAVVHNPIALPPPLPRRNAEIERLWTGTERRIISVGSLKRQKNHALLLRAFARLDQPANLMIVGEGELRPDLERLARDLGVADRLSMPGFAVDPWPYYASADLFVLSSDYEGFANVLVEALALGLAVISTDCESGPREILEGGKYGRLVPVGDVEPLAAAIDQAFHEVPDREALKARARQFRPEVAVDRYLELLLRPV